MLHFPGFSATGDSAPSRRRFLGGLVRHLPAALGGVFLVGCTRTTGTAGTIEEDASAPSEACVSGLEGLQLRAVEEGQPVTQDYRKDRLTLVLDKQGRISRSYIG